MKNSFFVTSIILGSSLFACGPMNGRSSIVSTSLNLPEIRPLIVGMSGYSTCTESSDYHDGELGPLGAQLFRQVEPIMAQITEKLNVAPALLASCFTDDRELITSSSLDGWKVNNPSDQDYLTSIQQQMEFFTHVFVVGHSYGGWLSMKLVESYQGVADKIKTLHTIDPISKELCYFDNVSECLSAPRDIKEPAREHIKANTETWVNAWQDVTFFLHSSPIPEADQNPQYEVEHWDIDNNEELWEDINRQVATSF